jgi:acylpyruvate hydrolase
VDLETVTLKPPVSRPGKIICIGLNFAQHAAEGGFETPEVPEVFARFSTSLVGGGEPLLRPRESVQLDFEGELAVMIGRPARRVDESEALAHVAGYCVFNEATLRDYQVPHNSVDPGQELRRHRGSRTRFGHRGRAS